MHTVKITPNLLQVFEYQCTSGKFIRLPNRIESKLFIPNWNALVLTGERSATSAVHAAHSPPLIRAYAVTAAHRLRFARVDDHNRPCCFSQLKRAT